MSLPASASAPVPESVPVSMRVPRNTPSKSLLGLDFNSRNVMQQNKYKDS